ncbi:DUF805 domain-containing protein [Weissella muntiaci]|uniref:DUF805 domain-containing protein n=1 Tax=Weissella muntiaci TaxID=2508881 RepID=A0A6C2C5P9_9LACO|nr:DUF805 domain-containing protein [Weissella muntiaci]TYC49072.1 DUF805 domain-containing protein [Weissella muntiaci]
MEYLLAFLNIKDGYQFAKPFSFKGRINRKDFFFGGAAWFVLVYLLMALVIIVLSGLLLAASGTYASISIGLLIALIYGAIAIMLILQGLGAMARRLRDAGVSPYVLWFVLLPFIGLLILAWHLIKPSQIMMAESSSSEEI